MKTMASILLVIGGGAGGYVAAICAGQLGIPTVLVEADKLDGTCLNVGCIPSKALTHAADEFHKACGFAGASPLGIQVQAPGIDLVQTQRWKDGLVGKLTDGVGVLLRKAGVKVVRGWATIVDGKTVDVATGDRRPATARGCASSANTCCWPPGRRRYHCPACHSGGR